MKNVFASLLVLCCLAAPTYAAQGWDGTLPDTLVILPPAEVDGDAYNAILKQMAATLSPELGKIGARVHIVPTDAVAPVYGNSWPDFAPYQKSVHDLYLELRSIKKTKAFASQGMKCPEARAWGAKVASERQRFAKAKLPPFSEQGFDELERLARAYAKSRTKLPSPLDVHFLEEDIYDARTNLDAILNSVVE